MTQRGSLLYKSIIPESYRRVMRFFIKLIKHFLLLTPGCCDEEELSGVSINHTLLSCLYVNLVVVVSFSQARTTVWRSRARWLLATSSEETSRFTTPTPNGSAVSNTIRNCETALGVWWTPQMQRWPLMEQIWTSVPTLEPTTANWVDYLIWIQQYTVFIRF